MLDIKIARYGYFIRVMVYIKIAILYIGNLVGVFVDIIIVGYCYFSWCKGRY